MILVGLLLVLGGIAYLVSPWVRQKVDGFKTYILASMPIIGTILDSIDPNLLSVALGLDARWKAASIIGIGIALILTRAVTSKPGTLAKT